MITDFTVSVKARDFGPLIIPAELQIYYRNGSASSKGGMVDAELFAVGPRQALYETLDWLRCPAIVYNRQGTAVWYGYIAEINAVIGALTIGISIDTVSNKIRVTTAYTNPEGRSVKSVTDWASDLTSQATYGIWELSKSLGGNRQPIEGIWHRDGSLALLAYPVGTPAIASPSAGAGTADQVTFKCRGWWASLSARYLVRTEGQVESSQAGGTAINLGQKLTANTIGFEPNNDYIHDIVGRMNYFKSDHWVQIAGSTSNNGLVRISRGTNQLYQSVHSTAIWFEAQDDIWGAGPYFDYIDANDLILISGAADAENNGYFFTDSVSDSQHIVVVQKQIRTKSAGPDVTIQRGNAVGTEGNFTRELPGATVSLTVLGEKISFSFIATGDTSWKLFEIAIRAMKVDTPTDGILCAVYTDSAGFEGTLLESVTVLAANVAVALNWLTFSFTGVTPLTPGTRYWVRIQRSGASHHQHYYQIDVDEDVSYAAGSVKLWTGAAWVNSPTPISIPFSIRGMEETTTQIQNAVSLAGQFMAGCQIDSASGRYTYQTRDGNRRVKDEAEDLLDLRASDGTRLLADVTEQRNVVLYKEPTFSAGNAYAVDLDGQWYDNVGSPLEKGILPVGKWVVFRDLPPEIAAYTRVTPFFVDEAVYDAEADEVRTTPRGAWSDRSLLGIRQG